MMLYRPSLLAAVSIYATNKVTDATYPWTTSLEKCTLGVQEQDLKKLANELFYFVYEL